MPLMIGMKPVGLIYADQATHDGTLYFREVFEALARLAAAALENLNLRLRAEQRAETDALTGLYNRYFLDKILELEIPRVKRYNHSISLLMLDLCDFKYFNDTYGHQFGDYILRETASLLQANVRRPDIVVRYGGDEFVVLMVNTTNEQAQLVKSRIEHAFIERNRMQTDDRYVIKISIGLRSADARTIESLLYEADMEMYAHKAHQTRLQLIESLLQANTEKIEAADRIVGSLCNILYKKAPYYPEHARRVAHLALMLARRLGMEEREVETLALAALLHDVGKVSIPTEILQKIEPLTASELAAMRHHPALGEEFFQGLEHLEPLRPIIRSHHERYDGQMSGEFPGYPDGLCGERIPLSARILKLAESVECMLYGLPYQAGRPPEDVARRVREESGKSFDPRLVSVLLADRCWYQELGEPERISELLNLEG
jgi:diguanylate cyclase (GGDEF)-like protein/putative nucleotidyltransferase with HDIG domain